MGLEKLKLINPRKVLNLECRKMAGHALDLVTNAATFPTFEEAVSEEGVLVAMTSGRKRALSRRLYSPREIAPIVLRYAGSQPVGLVFGPEQSGLTEAQLSRCQYLVSIPSSEKSPVLNLSQAVMLLAYEVSIACGEGVRRRKEPPVASQRSKEQMFQQMEEVLVQIGFLSSAQPSRIMDSIRVFLGRADLTPRDVRILRGLMRQMEWYVQEGYKLGPEGARRP